MKPGWVMRAAVILVAVGGIAVAVGLDRREDGCTDALKQMFAAIDERAPAPAIDATVENIESDCDGSTRLVDAGRVLFEKGDRVRAALLLREAVDREPDNFDAWAGLAVVLAKDDPEAAREAVHRAAELNSGYRPPS